MPPRGHEMKLLACLGSFYHYNIPSYQQTFSELSGKIFLVTLKERLFNVIRSLIVFSKHYLDPFSVLF